jgi:hypothetical protein
MSYTLHDIADQTLRKSLASLTDILKKAESHKSTTNFFDAKLYEDMLPFSYQVFRVCDIANITQAHMQGREKVDLGDNIRSFEDAYARIKEVSELLDQVDKDTFHAYADKTVEAGARNIRLKGADFVNNFVLPQTYFHLTTAYAILRKEGVPLGKTDYIVAWLGPYLK